MERDWLFSVLRFQLRLQSIAAKPRDVDQVEMTDDWLFSVFNKVNRELCQNLGMSTGNGEDSRTVRIACFKFSTRITVMVQITIKTQNRDSFL